MEFYQTIEEAAVFARLIADNLAETAKGLPLTQPEKQGNEYFVFFAGDNVIRIARNETVQKAIAKEVALMNELHQHATTANIPLLIEAQPENNFMVIKKLPGEILSAPMLATLPEQEQELIAGKLGAFIAELHSCMQPDPAILKTDPWYNWGVSLPKADEAIKNVDNDADLRRLQRVHDYMAHYHGIPDRFVTIHGDLWAGNILYDRKAREIGVIDFMDSRPDFAHRDFVTLSHFYPRVFVETIARAYEQSSGTELDMALVDTAQDASFVAHKPIKPGAFNFRLHLA